jgi:aspartate carbamoyltransferase catalytic subunit
MTFKEGHLLGLEYADREDIELILKTARSFREVLERPIKKVPTLQGKTVVNLFFESSTRTRISFELAEKRLSADSVNFSSSTSSVKKGETLLDTARNIEAMKIDMVVIRHASPGAPNFLAQNIDANIINAGDGAHEHPTQALLDMMTMLEKYKTIEGLKVAIIGGVDVSYHVDEVLERVDVINVLRIQLERQDSGLFPSLREYHNYFGITRSRLEKLSKPITIMHPGPINRGVEISSDVADSEHSLILNQVTNGVAIRMAVLYLLAGGENVNA